MKPNNNNDTNNNNNDDHNDNININNINTYYYFIWPDRRAEAMIHIPESIEVRERAQG